MKWFSENNNENKVDPAAERERILAEQKELEAGGFEKGAVVRFKSGGPRMTVDVSTSLTTYVSWFNVVDVHRDGTVIYEGSASRNHFNTHLLKQINNLI